MNDSYITPRWKNIFSDIKCGFTKPVLGNQALTRKSITSGLTTKENRIKLAETINVFHENIFSPHQIHSDIVLYADEKKRGKGAYSTDNAISGDSCITDKKNIMLITSFADCIPVLLYDPVKKIIASIHSGWKSTKQEICRKTIDKMVEYGANKENLYAAIGPGISDCCYKVGVEFKDIFNISENPELFKEKDGELFFNLSGFVYKDLLKQGIYKEKIDYIKLCTCCSKSTTFFSSRRDGAENFEGQSAFIVLT